MAHFHRISWVIHNYIQLIPNYSPFYPQVFHKVTCDLGTAGCPNKGME